MPKLANKASDVEAIIKDQTPKSSIPIVSNKYLYKTKYKIPTTRTCPIAAIEFISNLDFCKDIYLKFKISVSIFSTLFSQL